MRLTLATMLLILAAPWPVRAEHATIDLRVFRMDPATGESRAEASASADAEPPAGGIQPRPLFKVKTGEPLVLQFILVNNYPHGINKDVTVRYLVAREQAPKQKELPELGEGVVTQGRFVLNFKPKTRVGARVAFTIRAPGTYLLRVETINTGSDHEHFSAIDLRAD
jgi:hypothetical protein